ncbi:hypothetical protein [Paenibacillus woosongensis]|uniref:Uncharacterized protein n=1 Tax=Paenibacillus woosongensis TaxID=307580 RepID=A0A7X2Z0N0_9BACL|nr:hypothetical protein [Paenibacillus woosongensis]MUG45275.1 hypothetical protein [Paenibacillus woosongensis]
MILYETALNLIYDAMDEANHYQQDGYYLVKSERTPLSGKGTVLDSIGFVSFILCVEERIIDQFGSIPHTLLDEKVFSAPNSPFMTVSTLADYIYKLYLIETEC